MRMIITGFVFLLIYFICSIPITIKANSLFYVMMVWNVFLAVLPVVFAYLCERFKNKKGLAVLFGVIWLLFFPNAPYMVTDFIHIGGGFYQGTAFSEDLLKWVTLIFISAGQFFALYMGFVSLDKICGLMKNWKGRLAEYSMVFVVCGLSGYAVYIGRFLRFNSWDILNPIDMIMRLIRDFDVFALQSSLLFAGYLLFTYLAYRWIQNTGKRGTNELY